MFPVMLTAATMSLIHFTLNSGAKVELSYAPGYISEDQAIRAGVPMAETIWKDFCGPKPGLRCDAGEYYRIDLGLLVAKGLETETFNSCEGSISYTRRYSYGEVRPAHFEQWGFYDCYPNAGGPALRVVRAQMQLPALVPQSK
ncbi:MAG TPA: hypothetical protein VMD53_07895 [Rhizomicrobium sp.]|nr:hypothetical protein [Rhizomicrobium sp.]